MYKPDKTNVTDPLLRLYKCSDTPGEDENHVHQIAEYSRPLAVSITDIVIISENSKEICNVKKGIDSNDWNESVKT